MTIGRAIVVTAPGSGHGKTTVSLGLMRAFRDAGLSVTSAKSGHDYIDPAFHRLATGHPSINLDPWAMSADRRRSLLASASGDLTIVEGAMGALDSAADGLGSTADLAAELSLPAVLVVDVSGQGQSAAIAPAGLKAIRPDLAIAGIVLNNLGSSRHEKFAAHACEEFGFRVFGSIKRDPTLSIPTRH